MKSALTIAGSDSSGGAGIQADIKTMSALGVFAQSAITAITAQNTLGVRSVEVMSAQIVHDQIKCVFEDIRPDAVKIGMIASAELVETIAESLAFYQAPSIVLDPVMVATSGASLSSNDAVNALVEHLFPLAEVVTPNIPEAEVLAESSINSEQDMLVAAQKIQQKGARCVLVKGGHFTSESDLEATSGTTPEPSSVLTKEGVPTNKTNEKGKLITESADVFLKSDGSFVWLRQERIDTNNTHGTGCTLSSAIASFLAQGFDVEESCEKAKQYLTQALRHDIHLGKGHGPLNHLWEFYG